MTIGKKETGRVRKQDLCKLQVDENIRSSAGSGIQKPYAAIGTKRSVERGEELSDVSAIIVFPESSSTPFSVP